MRKRHPDLFDRAVAIEQKVLRDAGFDGDADYRDQAMKGRLYTWSGGETLLDLVARKEEILEKQKDAEVRARNSRKNIPLIEALEDALNEEDNTVPCTVCAI